MRIENGLHGVLVEAFSEMVETTVTLVQRVMVDGFAYRPPRVRFPRWWFRWGETGGVITAFSHSGADNDGMHAVVSGIRDLGDRATQITFTGEYAQAARGALNEERLWRGDAITFSLELHNADRLSPSQITRLLREIRRRLEWAQERRAAQIRHCQAVAKAQQGAIEALEAEIALFELETLGGDEDGL